MTVGSREYRPEIIEREQGTETTTKINNTEDATARAYTEEEVCQEIEEKLGVIAPRLIYKPQGMELSEYWIDEEVGEAVVKYIRDHDEIQIYISKDFDESSIHFEVDGIKQEPVFIVTNGIDVPVYEYIDSNNKCFQSEFEVFNTYYCITGEVELEEYNEILENLAISNM